MPKKPSKKLQTSTFETTIKVNSRAFGEIMSPAGETAIVYPTDLATALNGDTVEVLLHPKPTKKNQEQKAEVIRVISRVRNSFVGILEAEKVDETSGRQMYFVLPDDHRVYIDIAVLERDLAGAGVGDKVQVLITKWSDPKKEPLGKIVKILGRAGEHNAEMTSLVLEKGFDTDFPPEVEKAAEEAKNKFIANLSEEITRRRDMRNIATFTIDPADAKDFDDALSFQQLADGRFEVGVHIADVSYFVEPHSPLDDEAVKRATSIYLVDRTIPMLPEILSNDICSLVEKEDRLTYSAIFTLSPEGEIEAEWFGRTVINSNKRFSYEEVQNILDREEGPYHQELTTLNRLAYILRKHKEIAGAVSFEDNEVKIRLNETGHPIAIDLKERTDSHRLIEDFMLLANRRVAEYVSRLNRNKPHTFIYRVHDSPDIDKILSLKEFLAPLGYKLEFKGSRISSHTINRLLSESTGQAEEHMIARAAIRAMAKAVYSMTNIGHYGLAFEHYTHFTSPIRRYPDIIVHRLLEIYLNQKQPTKELLDYYGDLAIHCSERERQAAEAERDSIKYKQVEYMEDHVGQTYQGIISGVTDYGLYVEEMTTKADGMVRLNDLKDDIYAFDAKKFSLIGQQTGKRYRLGDIVTVKVKKADVKKKIIDYVLV